MKIYLYTLSNTSHIQHLKTTELFSNYSKKKKPMIFSDLTSLEIVD